MNSKAKSLEDRSCLNATNRRIRKRVGGIQETGINLDPSLPPTYYSRQSEEEAREQPEVGDFFN